MLRREKIFVEHEEIRILPGGNGSLFIFDAELLRAVDGESEKHLFNVHPLIGRREYRFISRPFLDSGLLRGPARHSDLHAQIRIPCGKVSKVDVVAGPGHLRTGIPDRPAAELLCGPFRPKPGARFLRVSLMPVRRKVCKHAKLCKPVQVRVILDLQMCTGNSHMELVTKLLLYQLHAVQYCT